MQYYQAPTVRIALVRDERCACENSVFTTHDCLSYEAVLAELSHLLRLVGESEDRQCVFLIVKDQEEQRTYRTPWLFSKEALFAEASHLVASIVKQASLLDDEEDDRSLLTLLDYVGNAEDLEVYASFQ